LRQGSKASGPPRNRSVSDKTAVQHLGHPLLDRLEAHVSARLALEMVDEPGEALEVHAAADLGAVVQVLLVCGTVSVPRRRSRRARGQRTRGGAEVLVERVQRVELAVAEVALVGVTVPRPVRRLVRGRPVPANQFLGYDAVRVPVADVAVDFVAAEITGPETGAALEVVGHARRRHEALAAKGAQHVLAAVDARVEVLFAGKS